MKAEFKIGADGVLDLLDKSKKPKDRREALRWSIAKWKYIVDNCGNIKDDNGSITCGLCLRYHGFATCSGCPIKDKTGKEYCQNTPYDDYAWTEHATEADKLVAAQNMLNFLRKIYKDLYGDK